MMRFRLGLILGLAIGYVLGARAGQERYEQIAAASRSLRRSQPAQQISTEVRKTASRAGDTIETKAAEGVAKVTDMVRNGEEAPRGSQSTLPPT
jgi:hypothetical protein